MDVEALKACKEEGADERKAKKETRRAARKAMKECLKAELPKP